MYKPKLIYYHDSRHYLLYRFDPPMSLHQLRKPVDDLIGTGMVTDLEKKRISTITT